MFCNTKKSILILLITFIFFSKLFSQSQGESLFKENKSKEAVQVLENEILNGLVTANTYNFLGLGYYQIGEYSKSIDAFNRGLAAQPTLSKILMYNQGNTYYAMKDYTSAVRCYSDVLKENPTFYDALLNRANALLMANQLKNAREEYIDYIAKCPNDPQRPEIEKLIKALEDEIARREEEERLLAEQNKAKWEEYDASINDENIVIPEEKNPDWEKVDARIAEEKKEEPPVETPSEEPKTEWEQVDYKVAEQKQPETPKTPWEKIDEEKLSAAEKDKIPDELVVLEDEWQNLSDEDQDELKELDKSSKEERERWLAEQKRQKELEKQREIERENEIKNAEKLRKQQLEEEERLAKEKRYEEDRLRKERMEEEEKIAREKLMEEMMRAENERKQKLLENVANSLQNSKTTNMTSGADDIIDYDLEGELD